MNNIRTAVVVFSLSLCTSALAKTPVERTMDSSMFDTSTVCISGSRPYSPGHLLKLEGYLHRCSLNDYSKVYFWNMLDRKDISHLPKINSQG